MRRNVMIGLLGAMWAASPAAAAEDELRDKFWLQAGAYYPDVTTSIRVEGPAPSDPATTINFERDLDFDERVVLPSLTAGMRIGTDWRVVGEFYRLSRSREATLDTEITFDDVTYPVNASVRGSFSSDVYRLSVGYSIINQSDVEAGLSVGAHVTDFAVGIAGSGSIGSAGASFQERRRELLAPLPTVGAYVDWQPARKLRLEGRLDYLSLEIDDYDGRLLNAQASAAYEVANGLDVGLMWRYVDYRVRVMRSDWTGQVNYRFSGPTLFLQYRFGG